MKFAIFIMRKFVEMSKNNKKIYMELLFWKNKKEADELEVGYNNADTKYVSKYCIRWSKIQLTRSMLASETG